MSANRTYWHRYDKFGGFITKHAFGSILFEFLKQEQIYVFYVFHNTTFLNITICMNFFKVENGRFATLISNIDFILEIKPLC